MPWLHALRSTLLLCVVALLVSGTSDWTRVLSSKGVTVYRRDVPGRSIPALRGVVTIDAHPLEVLAVMQDVRRHPEWIDGCEEARVLEQVTPTERFTYAKTNVLWPASDRDAVVHSYVTMTPGLITLRAEAAAHPAAPSIPRGTVRITRLTSVYRMRAIDGGNTRVTYEFDSDPAGTVPDWVVAAGAKKIPVRTLSALRARVARTRGSYSDFVAQWEPVWTGSDS